jgi:hypothetical protein
MPTAVEFEMIPVVPGAGVHSFLWIEFRSPPTPPTWRWLNNGMTTFERGQWGWEPAGFPLGTLVIRLYHLLGGAVQATLARNPPWKPGQGDPFPKRVVLRGECVTGFPAGVSPPDFSWRVIKII